MEPYLLLIQARIFCWAGAACLGLALLVPVDPLIAARRSAFLALLALLVSGLLLRLGARIIAPVMPREADDAEDGNAVPALDAPAPGPQ